MALEVIVCAAKRKCSSGMVGDPCLWRLCTFEKLLKGSHRQPKAIFVHKSKFPWFSLLSKIRSKDRNMQASMSKSGKAWALLSDGSVTKCSLGLYGGM